MIGTWVRRSLRYYGARHLVFAATVALASAILAAAMLAGESLQSGLRRGLRERLGATRSAVHLSESVFPASLAERLPGSRAALLLRGQLLDASGAVCADQAQIIGVAEEARSVTCLPPAEAARLLQECGEPNPRASGLLPRGECAVRFEKPSLLSVEMPLGAATESRLVRRSVYLLGQRAFRAESLLPPDFALQAASMPPVNIFQPLGPLAEAAGVPGSANLLVSSLPRAELEHALARALTPEDAGLTLEAGVPGLDAGGRASPAARPETLVKSRRVFLPQGLGAALAAKGLAAEWATFHLADAFEAGTNATPYGFVAAVTPGLAGAPAGLKDDEIVINAWLAEALGLATNDTLTLRWRRFEAGGRLVADSREFRVRGVLQTEAAALAKRLMPVFPGLEGVDSCSAWDVGLPMDEEKLKDPSNEAYWKQWRETPKAFLTFEAGRACFGAAFGGAMCVRVAAGEPTVREALRALTPAQFGFAVRPLWDEGLAVATGSTDFKGLFVGMAFVLVASALLLGSLSLSLALERRKGEVALLGALGWRRLRIAQALAAEWCAPLAAGALAGAGLGAALAQALVWGLGRFWNGAFAGARISFAFSWPVAGLAAAVSAALAFVVLLGTVRRFARCRPVELWQAVGREGSEVRAFGRGGAWPVAESAAGGLLAVAAGISMALSPSGAAANGAFFGAGFMLLVSLLLFVKGLGRAWRCRLTGEPKAGCAGAVIASPFSAGTSRALLAPRRSAPVVVTLAVGVFLATGILSMKHDPADGCERPSSGSGGFASLVTSVTPLERERGLVLALRVSGSKGAVPVRVHDGDEAGCLNMNRPARPRVLGLDASAMARARAFEPEDAGGVWSVLGAALPDGALPALAADQTMLQYSLKAKAGLLDGTTYEYAGAGGRTVRVRVVGALPVRSGILQGALLIDERRFAEAFPDAGYRLWLCDGAPLALREAAGGGGRRPEDGGQRTEDGDLAADLRPPISAARHPEPGVTVETAAERLRLLGSVESAYLDMFLVLGGLGVALGVFGVALVILRGVEERRGELATLSALGLPRAAVARLLAAEYGALVAAGLACGVLPALAAIQPAARSLGGRLPWAAMAGVVATLALCAGFSVWAAAVAASRRFGAEVLKEEA